MEIPEVPQPPGWYSEFVLRRVLWQNCGLLYDETPHHVVEEAWHALAMEKRHPQRFKAKKE